MRSLSQTIADHARREAASLRADLTWVAATGDGFGNYWDFSDHVTESKQRARASQAIELLRQYAGETSVILNQAKHRLTSNGRSDATGIYELADQLDAWADSIEAGLIEMPARLESARVEAATDLMEQVRILLGDGRVHPSAPVMLAGAAIEEFLRSLVERHGLPLPAKLGIQSYAETLRSASLISRQQMKDITQIAGLRNAAAHGEFDDLSRSHAGLMEQQINLLITALGLQQHQLEGRVVGHQPASGT